MHEWLLRFPKTNDNHRQLLIKIIAKYILSLQNNSQNLDKIDLTLQTS